MKDKNARWATGGESQTQRALFTQAGHGAELGNSGGSDLA